MNNEGHNEVKYLKIILWVYIIFCIVIAGLNYGLSGRATSETQALIAKLWHFYENWIKTLFIIVGGFLTYRIIKRSKRSKMRKRNLIGFIIAALIVHIIAPLVFSNKEMYFFTMPLPWTTTPLQLLYADSGFYLSRFGEWGATGISAALIFYVFYSVIVVVGTLLFGRRLQCSTLCLFNGFIAEVFSPAVPLIGKKKQVKPKRLRILMVIKWVFFVGAVFFTLWWLLFLLNIIDGRNHIIISQIEVFKYLGLELFAAMFFWIAFLGRGYCYYCPLGSLLAMLGKVAGQRILTDKSKCIECNKCNETCPMSIDIRSKAKDRLVVKSTRCVGCGHCVDMCPTETLSYTTRFIEKTKRIAVKSNK